PGTSDSRNYPLRCDTPHTMIVVVDDVEMAILSHKYRGRTIKLSACGETAITRKPWHPGTSDSRNPPVSRNTSHTPTLLFRDEKVTIASNKPPIRIIESRGCG